MSVFYDCFLEASHILMESDNTVTEKQVRVVLEDVSNPITNRYIENLYKQVISKSHIDFDDIPRTNGIIKNYAGYIPMMETLNNLKNLSLEDRSRDTTELIDTVITSISNIESMSALYERGFREKNEYVILEYNTFVFCCVEATSSILSEFVEFIKGFDKETYQVKLKNTKYKANKFFIEQLEKFNRIYATGNYRNYLTSILDNGRENFVGATVVGVLAVAAAVLVGIVPVTRTLVYHFFRMKTKLSDALALQAYYLEINKTCVEANQTLDPKKKESILKKQQAVQLLFMKMSAKLKNDNAKALRDSIEDKKKDNATLTLGDTRSQIDNSSYGDLL